VTRHHRGQLVDAEEPGMAGLVVIDHGLTAHPPTQEVVVEELALIAIGIGDGGSHVNPN